MANIDLLKSIITEKGMTKKAVAEMSGITRASFYSKLDGRVAFRIDEVMAITKTLHLSKSQRDQIFLE